jgi:hypothetical protein
MAYSITTKDGITLNNIPDDVPADSPLLKQRVASIRGQGGQTAAPVGAASMPAAPAMPTAAPAQPAPTMTAPSFGIGMGLRDPVDAGAQILRRIVPDSVGNAVDSFGNWLADKGLPVTRSNGVKGVDSVVKGVNAAYDQQRQREVPATLSSLATGEKQDPGFDWGRLGGNLANPINYMGGGMLKGATTVSKLAKGGAAVGAISGALQPVLGDTEDFGTTKLGQMAMGAAGGALLTPAISRTAEAATQGAQSLLNRVRPPVPSQNINIAVNNTLASEGMKLADAPPVILQSVQRQVEEAVKAGGKIDPAAIMRKAQFEAVGLTGDAAPTLGQMTRDPMQFANEKNLSGVRIKTPQGEGNQLADRFQAQNQRLGDVFDLAGANGATDRVTAGQTIIDALRGADAPVKQGVDEAYNAARAMTGGRAAELERGVFSQTANDALDQGMWGRFVPPEIRGLLNDVTEGKTPFTVDSAVQIDGILSSAQRTAKRQGNDAQAAAIGVIRDSLHNTPMARATPAAQGAGMDAGAQASANAARTVDEGVTDVAGRMAPGPTALPGQPALGAPPNTALAPDFEIPLPRQGTAVGQAIPPAAPPIDEGAAARQAFEEARRAARSRFATIEETPSLKAALDEAAPDKFVQQFILNADVRDVEAMRRVLQNSPEAMDQARAQVAEHLKRAAFGENPSGDKAFTADRYLRTLRAMGRQKLEAFFTEPEILRLNLAGKVASDINGIPSGARYATNTSGSGAAIMNLLSNITESPIIRQIPGARMIANQIGEIKTERAINNALSPQPAQLERQLSPETMRALQFLYPASGATGGVLGGMSAN